MDNHGSVVAIALLKISTHFVIYSILKKEITHDTKSEGFKEIR